MDNERLLTMPEAAAYLSVKVPMIRKLMKDGKLKYYRLSGRMVRIKLSDILQYLEEYRIIETL